MRRALLLLIALPVLAACDASGSGEIVPPPRPDARFVSPAIPVFGVTPPPQLLAWQDMEVNAFIHFGVNTFTDREWGTGDEDPSIFNPTALDTRQWAIAARDGGIRGLVLTAKHHDGFALYPTQFSDHSVANSPWRGGQGDVVEELAEATREVGLEYGIYLSPWDMHEPTWGTTDYNDFYVGQLNELINPLDGFGYGRPFQFWLDGAHGPEVTQAQRDTYDWNLWHHEIRRHQPGITIAFTDVRWSGNEAGTAPETHWYEHRGRWSPIECNSPFRTGWFWHPDEDPKSLAQLMDIYFASVGRDCTLIIGLAPDRRGLLEDEDVVRLREWKAAIDHLFAVDLAAEAPSTATSTRAGSAGWAAGAATDGDLSSFWAADSPQATLTTDLGAPQDVSIVELREPVRFGQRVASYRVEAKVGDAWQEVARGTTIGRRRLLRFPVTRAQEWRVVIDSARADVALSQFALYTGASRPTARWR